MGIHPRAPSPTSLYQEYANNFRLFVSYVFSPLVLTLMGTQDCIKNHTVASWIGCSYRTFTRRRYSYKNLSTQVPGVGPRGLENIDLEFTRHSRTDYEDRWRKVQNSQVSHLEYILWPIGRQGGSKSRYVLKCTCVGWFIFTFNWHLLKLGGNVAMVDFSSFSCTMGLSQGSYKHISVWHLERLKERAFAQMSEDKLL